MLKIKLDIKINVVTMLGVVSVMLGIAALVFAVVSA
jgi:hypothetical protein